MGGAVARARRRASFAAKPGTDEMVLGKKALEVFVGCADVIHGYFSLNGW
ncbi:MAG: hypothetical protein WD688_14510 [Candidatus Binatia bacterium]